MDINAPLKYTRKRLRTILSFKYLKAEYVFKDLETEKLLFVPIDIKYGKIENFKLSAHGIGPNQDILLLSVGHNENTISVLNNDIVLWYEKIRGGKIYETNIGAYSVNTEYTRPEFLKHYFHVSNLEGLYVYVRTLMNLQKIDVYIVYEDLDSMESK